MIQEEYTEFRYNLGQFIKSNSLEPEEEFRYRYHFDIVSDIKFIKNSTTLAVAADTDVAFIEHKRNVSEQNFIEGADYHLIYTIQIAKSEKKVFIASYDSTIKIYELKDGEWDWSYSIENENDIPINQIILSADEDILYALSQDKTMKIWRNDGEKWTCIYQKQDKKLNEIAYTPEYDLFAYGLNDNLSIWRIGLNKKKALKYQNIQQAHTKEEIHNVSFIRKGNGLISSIKQVGFKLWGRNPVNNLYEFQHRVDLSGENGIFKYNAFLDVMYFSNLDKKILQLWKFNYAGKLELFQEIYASQSPEQGKENIFEHYQISDNGRHLAIKESLINQIQMFSAFHDNL